MVTYTIRSGVDQTMNASLAGYDKGLFYLGRAIQRRSGAEVTRLASNIGFNEGSVDQLAEVRRLLHISEDELRGYTDQLRKNINLNWQSPTIKEVEEEEEKRGKAPTSVAATSPKKLKSSSYN